MCGKMPTIIEAVKKGLLPEYEGKTALLYLHRSLFQFLVLSLDLTTYLILTLLPS